MLGMRRKFSWCCVLAVVGLAACDDDAPTRPPVPTPAPTPEARPVVHLPDAPEDPEATEGELLYTYRSELLRSSDRTNRYVIDTGALTPVLNEEIPYRVIVEVAIECSDAESLDEVEDKMEAMSSAVYESFSTKKLAYVRSAIGKLRLKDEIVWRMQKRLDRKGVRDVYFQHLLIERD